jgi:hypothetical protein
MYVDATTYVLNISWELGDPTYSRSRPHGVTTHILKNHALGINDTSMRSNPTVFRCNKW